MTGIKVFLYGLDYAGKTALSETIKRDLTFTNTKPTLSIIMSKMLIKNTTFFIWDAPGQTSLRDTWERGVKGSKLLIFVLDTSDNQRFEEAKREFYSILNDTTLKGIPLIFCFHKMDLGTAQENLIEAQNKFELNSIKERKVILLETSIMLMDSIEALKEKMVATILD
ncbi:MAG TPA: ADP-ribosylation factor-like protein [Candidatus Lokiarchaeia archaeon]